MRVSLGGLVIAQNEEENLKRNLPHLLELCDIVVVVDGGSQDRTPQVARSLGAHVVRRPFTNFGDQRRFALSLLDTDYVLWLDADETPSPELKEAIRAEMQNPRYEGYYLRRVNHFLNRPVRHGAFAPERVLRLFRRDRAFFPPRWVHERVHVRGYLGELPGVLLHYPYPDLSSFVRKADRYAELAAQEMAEQGRNPGLLCDLVLRPLWAFWKHFLLKRGFLEGKRGFVAARLVAAYTFLKYAKLWSLIE